MKIYILKNRATAAVANFRAEQRTDAKDYVIREKGWKDEDVELVEERPTPTTS